MDEAEYTIRGGAADADRLQRQAEVMAGATMAFLRHAGIGPAMTCLDVGCGDGQVAIALARLVGPAGRVVGIDIDRGAIAIVREAAQAAAVDVTFVEHDASIALDYGDFGSFDLAFARLVLSHLVDPMSVIRTMRDAVGQGGVVAVEDLFTPSLHAEPPEPALARLASIYSATVRAHGGDPAIGPRLAAHLTGAGLEEVREVTVENPMTTTYEKLFLAQLLDNMRTSILGTGAATADELDEVRTAVAVAAERADTTFFQARIHQVSARKP